MSYVYIFFNNLFHYLFTRQFIKVNQVFEYEFFRPTEELKAEKKRYIILLYICDATMILLNAGLSIAPIIYPAIVFALLIAVLPSMIYDIFMVCLGTLAYRRMTTIVRKSEIKGIDSVGTQMWLQNILFVTNLFIMIPWLVITAYCREPIMKFWKSKSYDELVVQNYWEASRISYETWMYMSVTIGLIFYTMNFSMSIMLFRRLRHLSPESTQDLAKACFNRFQAE